MTAKRLLVGASGASGMPLLVRCLERLREADGWESHLILSDGAKRTIECECGSDTVSSGGENSAVAAVEGLADRVYDVHDIAAAPASGTFEAAGMLLVPCSMKTLAGICSGYADNLLLRAADVTIKERRPLVLCARESPLSPIHLRNMHELSVIPGVQILPPMLSFYHEPKTIDDMVDQIAARLLAPFGIEAVGLRRWG